MPPQPWGLGRTRHVPVGHWSGVPRNAAGFQTDSRRPSAQVLQSWNLAVSRERLKGRQVLLRWDQRKKNNKKELIQKSSPHPLHSLSSGELCEGGVSTEALMTPFIRFPSEESITGACWELLEGNTPEPMKRSRNSRPQRLQASFPPEVSVAHFARFLYVLLPPPPDPPPFLSPAKEPMRPEVKGWESWMMENWLVRAEGNYRGEIRE